MRALTASGRIEGGLSRTLSQSSRRQRGHLVLPECRIPRDKGQPLGPRLGNQHAVERVGMVVGQPSGEQTVTDGDGQGLEPVDGQYLFQAVGQRSFPRACLMPIFQADAALTKTRLSAEAMAARPGADNRAGSSSHHSRACVSSYSLTRPRR